VSVKLALLAKTRMVDFAREEHEKHGVAVPAALTQRRAALIAEHKALAGRTAELRKLLEEVPAPSQELLAQRNIAPAQVEDLLRFARFQFDAGNYSQASEYLAAYRALAGREDGGLLWGRLAAEILLQDWTGAQERLARLREVADKVRSLIDQSLATF
jgi:translation initiation factor 3 subunit E